MSEVQEELLLLVKKGLSFALDDFYKMTSDYINNSNVSKTKNEFKTNQGNKNLEKVRVTGEDWGKLKEILDKQKIKFEVFKDNKNDCVDVFFKATKIEVIHNALKSIVQEKIITKEAEKKSLNDIVKEVDNKQKLSKEKSISKNKETSKKKEVGL